MPRSGKGRGPSSSHPEHGGNWPSTTGRRSGARRGNAPRRSSVSPRGK